MNCNLIIAEVRSYKGNENTEEAESPQGTREWVGAGEGATWSSSFNRWFLKLHESHSVLHLQARKNTEF